ncbi:Sec31p NDAI_0A02880 [Naumovozyma dairenensis CBS 421]|uniref:Protein transport protein SEC31 n=1 Tax=Naumovozyma dairenensis (strain ATCC 10597 / BCRC 20456 / CBS 421 / NBRC 0211 / NRRL Y-12639) TaxID=1071378 RepID=G0W3Q7_NAUDC|nr:hypothetical protein NDAI_0A02880 [Naumovozyma dairenensis CBS 421]CCD22445.1 hypothetical protein NDAI_0A02880 [Naumovozyma dairenensis CBS 421]
MVKLAEYSRTATFAWSHHKIPYLITGTASGTVDANFSSDSTLELWSLLSTDTNKPVTSLTTDAKFNDLDWSHTNDFIAGALDNGKIELFSFEKNSDIPSLKSISQFAKHTGATKVVRFNPKQTNLFASGGSNNGEIFIWDVTKLTPTTKEYTPQAPGVPLSQIAEITSLAWNKSLAHVFASAGSTTHASIWDLKAKKEVIHLNYTSPTTGLKPQLSVVEWHPMNSTRVATATGADKDPSILVWDLRNSNIPLQVMSQTQTQGGILSLDWCSQDESLMLASGRDNTVTLWNPETGKQLTTYPSRTNWCFKTQFAPESPDIFASASFDSKIEVVTLQDLTNELDKQETVSKQSESEADFWNHVNQDDQHTKEKPIVWNAYTPKWYGAPSPAAHWGFGGKLVRIAQDGKSVILEKPNVKGLELNMELNDALKSNDFKPLINKRLAKKINKTNEDDWNLLEKISMDGKVEFLKDAFSFDDEDEDEEVIGGMEGEKESGHDSGDEFFEKIETNYQPSGPFTLEKDIDTKIIKNLVSNKYKEATKLSLESDLLMEALVIALDSEDEYLKDMVKNAYFAKTCSKSALSRIVYSISKKDVQDMIQNLDIEQWKLTLKTILKVYAEGSVEQKSSLVELGDKLLANNKRQDALVVYLAAESLDKMATLWLKEFPILEEQLKNEKDKTLYEAHSECLTEFIERFTVLSKFAGDDFKIHNEQLISKFLEFVEITAAGGNFELASSFLEILPKDNEEVNSEKERVLIAAGKTIAKATPTAATTTMGSRTRKPHYINSVNPHRGSNASYVPPMQNQPALPTGLQMYGGAPAATSQRAPSVVVTPKVNPYAADLSASVSAHGNRYAPPPNVGPISNKNVPFQQQQQQPNAMQQVNPPFVPPPNPYATTAAASLAAGSTPGSQPNAFVPLNSTGDQFGAGVDEQLTQLPPPVPSHMHSGQSPHLNRKANDGWNDLPIKIEAKPSRAKAVSVAKTGVTSGNAGNSGISSNVSPNMAGSTNMPPPPLSRATSSASMMTPGQPPVRSSRIPSLTQINGNIGGIPVKQPVNPYAPPAQTASRMSSVAQSPAKASSPYAPQLSSVSIAPSTNPYAPNTLASNPTLPPNTYGSNAPPMRTEVPPAQQIGPPPINRKRGAQSPAHATNATEILNKAQNASLSMEGTSPLTTRENSVNIENVQAVGIPEDQQPIVDYLKEELVRVTPLTPKEYHKQLKDCDKRLKILYGHLERQDLLTQPTINELKELVECMKQKDYTKAMQIHTDIGTNHPEEGGNWLTGVKRLIGLADATA